MQVLLCAVLLFSNWAVALLDDDWPEADWHIPDKCQEAYTKCTGSNSKRTEKEVCWPQKKEMYVCCVEGEAANSCRGSGSGVCPCYDHALEFGLVPTESSLFAFAWMGNLDPNFPTGLARLTDIGKWAAYFLDSALTEAKKHIPDICQELYYKSICMSTFKSLHGYNTKENEKKVCWPQRIKMIQCCAEEHQKNGFCFAKMSKDTLKYPDEQNKPQTNHRPCTECVSRTNSKANCTSSSTPKAKYYSDGIVAINNEFLKKVIKLMPNHNMESFRENKDNEPALYLGLGPLTRCKLESHFICIDPDTGDWCDPP